MKSLGWLRWIADNLVRYQALLLLYLLVAGELFRPHSLTEIGWESSSETYVTASFFAGQGYIWLLGILVVLPASRGARWRRAAAAVAGLPVPLFAVGFYPELVFLGPLCGLVSNVSSPRHWPSHVQSVESDGR